VPLMHLRDLRPDPWLAQDPSLRHPVQPRAACGAGQTYIEPAVRSFRVPTTD